MNKIKVKFKHSIVYHHNISMDRAITIERNWLLQTHTHTNTHKVHRHNNFSTFYRTHTKKGQFYHRLDSGWWWWYQTVMSSDIAKKNLVSDVIFCRSIDRQRFSSNTNSCMQGFYSKSSSVWDSSISKVL